MNLRTGFIGLGAMGAPMARNLAKARLLGCIWNRTPAKAQALAAELEIGWTPEPAELARQCDVIALCVSEDQDVMSVVEALLPALKPGTVVIDHSTVSVATALEIAGKIEHRQGEFLDAPVSGGVEGARDGTLSIMVGGKAEILQRTLPILETIGSRITHMGDHGAGQATKAVNQVLCAGINQAVTEALAFGRALGLDLDKVIDVVSRGAAGNWFLEKRGPTMIRGKFDPGFKLALHHKDLKICQAMARELDLTLEEVERTLEDYERLLDNHGQEDISALYRLKHPDR